MSFDSGSSQQPAPKSKQLGVNDYAGATNERGNCLPYFAGRRRFAGTFITDAFAQKTIIAPAGGGKSSGKGNTSGGAGVYYFASFAAAMCLGPVDGFHGLWLNGEAVYTQIPPLAANSLRQAENLATFVASAQHGYDPGETFTVQINGADQPEFNGEFLATASSYFAFTYTIPGAHLAVERATGTIRGRIKLEPVWRGEADFTRITIPLYGIIRIYWGTETQPPDDYLLKTGTRHPSMKGVCYVVFEQFYIGLNQTNIQNVELELSRQPAADWLADPAEADIAGEANPAVVFYELLTSQRAGIGLTRDDFDLPALAAAATRFKTEGLGLSPMITRADSAAAIVGQLCEHVDAGIVLKNGRLALNAIRPPADYSALEVIGDDELCDLPKPAASGWADTANLTRVVFPNRDAGWANDYVEWRDFGANAATRYLVQPLSLQRDWITTRSLAAAVVQAAGLAASVPARKGTLEIVFTPARWTALTPGSVFKLDYSLRPESGGYFRVTRRSLRDPSEPKFEIEYVLDRSYLNLAT